MARAVPLLEFVVLLASAQLAGAQDSATSPLPVDSTRSRIEDAGSAIARTVAPVAFWVPVVAVAASP